MADEIIRKVYVNERPVKPRGSVQEILDRKRARERRMAKLKKDSAKLRLSMRIRKQEAWLHTLEKANRAINSIPLPESYDWNTHTARERERERREERGVQRMVNILKQEKKVDQLKRAYKSIYGKEDW
jgi:hypothetical protein